MNQPSPDVRAVLRSLLLLTTQVKRIADHTAQSTVTLAPAVVTGTDDAPTTGDDAPCRRIETRTCPPSYNGPCGERPCARFEADDPGPWLDPATVRVTHWNPLSKQLAEEKQELAGMVGEFIDAQMRMVPADDEDMLRTARRDSLLVLLSRAARGTLIPEEGDLLRHHVETEIREGEQQRTRADQAEEDARRALEQRQEMAEERHALQEQRDAADRLRAEVQRDRDQHAAVLTDILSRFTTDPYAGHQCLNTVPDHIFKRWQAVIAPTAERPWWQTVAEVRAELEQAQAAIERVRTLADRWDSALAPARSQYSGPVRAALDYSEAEPAELVHPDTEQQASAPEQVDEHALASAEQPTTEA